MKKAFATPILQRLACRAGVKVVVEPRYGYAGQVVLPDGTKRYFRGTNFDLNPLGASEIAKDKDYAAYFLRLMGYNTLDGEAFFTPDWNRIVGARRGPGAAYRYAKHIGFPVVVKPNSLSQGAMVTVVHNKRELEQAVRAIAKKDRVFLVQRLASGHDLRVVVLDGRIISAYERLPLTVAGDGRSTISQLLRKKQASFKRNGRDTIIKQDDFRITNRLRRFGLTRRSILAKGRKLALLDNRNLSSGGDAVDATGILHASLPPLVLKHRQRHGFALLRRRPHGRRRCPPAREELQGDRNQCGAGH